MLMSVSGQTLVYPRLCSVLEPFQHLENNAECLQFLCTAYPSTLHCNQCQFARKRYASAIKTQLYCAYANCPQTSNLVNFAKPAHFDNNVVYCTLNNLLLYFCLHSHCPSPDALVLRVRTTI